MNECYCLLVTCSDEMMLFFVADESLQAWRNGTRHWVNNLRNWLDFIRSVDSDFPNFNLDNLLVDIGEYRGERCS